MVPRFAINRLAFTAPLWVALLFLGLPEPSRAQTNELRIVETGTNTLLVEVLTRDYRLETLSIAGRDYIGITAPGYGHITSIGKPLLPTTGFLVGTPPQGNFKVVVLEEEWITRKTDPICPVPKLVREASRAEEPGTWHFSPDDDVYQRDAFYPVSLEQGELLGLFRGQSIGRVQLFPFRYNPARGELKVCQRLVVRVDFAAVSDGVKRDAGLSPRSPVVERVLSDVLVNYSQARPWRQEGSAEDLPRTMARQEMTDRCKITVSEDGLYTIGRQELLDAGLDLQSVDPQTLLLSNRGNPVPIYVRGEKDGSFDPGDAIEFYGQANRWPHRAVNEDIVLDPYSSENIYWLSWDAQAGPRMVQQDGGIQNPGPQRPVSFVSTVHAEKDHHRDHLNKQLSFCDHWFWDSGVGAQQLKDYSIQLSRPDRDSPLRPRVRVMLHGLTSSEEHDPDHHVLIYLNDQLVADRTWDGQNKLLLDSSLHGFELTSSTIQDGDNTLSLVCPGDTEAGPIDRILLNWIEVEYPRLYWAENDYLEFSKPIEGPPGLYQYTIKGFSAPSVWIYKLGTSVVVNGQGKWVQDNGRTSYQITFQDQVLDDATRYVAVGSGAKKRVDAIELRPASNLMAAGKGADYVIIVHPDLHQHVLPLAEFRRGQGLQVEVVSAEEIYDGFSHGLFTPEAIRDFLRYAYRNWNPQPLYVLLVGDGSWDYKNSMGFGGDFIPPIMTQTSQWGATACDNLYASVSGDDLLPDLFLGRLPVKTNGQLDALINKIITAEMSPELGDWRRRLLFICGSGSQGPIFRSQSETLIENHIGLDFITSRVYAYSSQPATDPFFGGTQDLIDAFDEGISLVNFIGHGGGGIWSDAGLMRLEDVDRLRNSRRWPAVFSLTCFTAAFDEPKRDALGERLVLAEDKGAIAFWGASGLGWLYGDYNLDVKLMESIFSREHRIVGQAVTTAKLQYMATYTGQIAQDLVNEYNLLGDPASRISFPQEKVSLTIEPRAVNPGDSLNIRGTMDGVNQGQADLTLLDGAGEVLWESSLSVAEGQFQTRAGIPLNCSTGTGTVRCYLWSPQNSIDGSGAASFSLNRAFFDTIFTSPERPTAEDTVHIWAEINAPVGIDSVFCHWRFGVFDSSYTMVAQSSPQRFRTLKPIPAHAPGVTVRYQVIVDDSSGQRTTSQVQKYQIPTLADLHIAHDGIAVGGEEQVGLVLEVENLGVTAADSVLVRATVTEPTAMSDVKEGLVEYLPGESQTSLFLPWDLSPGAYQVLAEVDPGDAIPEGDEDNNATLGQIEVNRVNVTPQEGTVVAGQHAPAASLDGNFSCEIPTGVVSRPQVLTIQAEVPSLKSQPDLTPAALATGEQLAYRIRFVDSTAVIADSSPLFLTFQLDDQDSLNLSHRDQLAVYRWSSEIDRWIRHGQVSWPSPQVASARVFGLGLFCAIISADQTPPSIEVTVEDQNFADGALVSSNAKIVAVVQDLNGVDVVERHIGVSLNEQVVDAQQIVLSAGADRNSVAVSYTAKLPTGKHTVAFSAYDCNGNFASKQVQFLVIDSYGIDHLGNYPNPFDRETVFTYRLTGPNPANEISMKVYTVSGRLVRSFDDFVDDFGRPGTQLDYHAMAWDGRDADGDRLANGVYFYKIRAKWDDQTVEEHGKLAILR